MLTCTNAATLEPWSGVQTSLQHFFLHLYLSLSMGLVHGSVQGSVKEEDSLGTQ
jgi:hypothetical protein